MHSLNHYILRISSKGCLRHRFLRLPVRLQALHGLSCTLRSIQALDVKPYKLMYFRPLKVLATRNRICWHMIGYILTALDSSCLFEKKSCFLKLPSLSLTVKECKLFAFGNFGAHCCPNCLPSMLILSHSWSILDNPCRDSRV